eukprot:m51a1_g11587 putative crooked neck-like protein 1 (714) ;mRNA; r:67193-70901
MMSLDSAAPQPKQNITDPEELAEYRATKRKGFEDAIRRNRSQASTWLKYAGWEEAQGELERARSCYERALDEDYRNVTFWLKYAELEMRHRNVARARNVWNRAVTLLPRVSQLWYKWCYFEDILGNYAGAREVFDRWMRWQPAEHAWAAYVKFELRVGEAARARDVYERFVACHPSVRSWLKYAAFEEKRGETARARDVFTRAVDALGDEANDERLFVAFAKFEERAHEDERARAIYRYALDHLPRQQARELYAAFVAFEKTHGGREGLEDAVVSKRRFQYEDELRAAAAAADAAVDYDVWFDYVRLEEEHGDVARAREVYERAIARVPPAQEKRYWRRYVYLWIKYALFEELDARDAARAREVYRACARLVPHKRFSFSKLWVLWAKLEIRQGDLAAARRVLGNALGVVGDAATRDKVYAQYIAVETQLGEIERCRRLHEGRVRSCASNVAAYLDYAAMERRLGEDERARAILELGASQPLLDTPEVLWKTYIELEMDLGEHDRVRELYRRLLARTRHVKVWVSYARFEFESARDAARGRAVLDEGEQACAAAGDEGREDRVALLDAWLALEKASGDAEGVAAVQKRMPKRLRKQRVIKAEDGSDAGWEEYIQYIFPGEESAAPNLKLLEKAHLWKRQRLAKMQQQQQPEDEPQPAEPKSAESESKPAESEPKPAEAEHKAAEPEPKPATETSAADGGAGASTTEAPAAAEH